MPRPIRVFVLVALAVVCGASGIVARQQNAPGMPTLARVFVLNETRAEAVPVKMVDAEPLSVLVAGVPTVAAQTQVARQRWEYRTVTIQRGTDPATLLNAAGADFWETTGVAFMPTNDSVLVVLKRPRLQ